MIEHCTHLHCKNLTDRRGTLALPIRKSYLPFRLSRYQEAPKHFPGSRSTKAFPRVPDPRDPCFSFNTFSFSRGTCFSFNTLLPPSAHDFPSVPYYFDYSFGDELAAYGARRNTLKDDTKPDDVEKHNFARVPFLPLGDNSRTKKGIYLENKTTLCMLHRK